MHRSPSMEDLLARAAPRARAFLSAPGETIALDTLDDGVGPEPGEAGDLHELAILGTLGTGGMSVVRLARQEPVGRDVAVKTLKDDARTPQLARRLLHEALLTGALEHPNVVPLHDLRIDEAGTPLVVLKRIEGLGWDEVLDDPTRIPDADDGVEPLVWHLRVLIAVCRAMEFAHDRGVLHRDLKPANVMVGRFSEVTLLDWGLGVCIDPAGSPRLPRWSPTEGVVGTPAYMAPEMLEAGRPPTPATDIYLLGACLVHVLTGRPPHAGADLEAMVGSIRDSRPPEDGPDALVALCAAAMSREPAARPASVADFRRTIERYLEDRAFDQLAAAAAERLGRLRAAVDSDDLDAVPTLLAACRFGFGEVLTRRPDHALARVGLDDALHLAARAALAQDQPDVALRTLAEAERPDPALLATAQAAADARAAAVSRAADILATQDPAAGRRARVLLAAPIWMGFGVVPLFFLDIENLEPLPAPVIAGVMVVGLGTAALLLLRPQLIQNRPLRMFIVLLALMPPAQGLAELGLRMRGVGIDVAIAMPLLLGAVFSVVGAMLMDARVLLAAATYAGLWLASGTSMLSPAIGVAIGNAVLGLCGLWVFLSARMQPAGGGVR